MFMIFLIYTLLTLVGLIMSFSVAVYFPEYAKYFVRENGIVENSSTWLFFFSAIMSLLAALIVKEKKYVPFSFLFAGIILFLEEISWGRDIIRYRTYKIMGVRIDSFHDFLDVFVKVLDKYWYWHKLFFSLTFLLLSMSLAFILIKKWKFFAEFFVEKRGVFIGSMFLFFSLSAIIDSHIVDFSGFGTVNLIVLEEYFEFNAALAFFFLSAGLMRDGLNGRYGFAIKNKL